MKLKNIAFLILIALTPLVTQADDKLDAAVVGTALAGKGNLAVFVGGFIKSVIGILGIILVVLIIYGGFIWMTAGGDAKKIDQAKNILKASIIGLLICMSAYIITYFVITNITK